MRMAASQRSRRVLVVAMALLLVAAFIALEIGVRLLPPDAVRYAAQQTTNGETVFTKSGTITDPATIARWRAAMTKTPSGIFLWQQGGTCAPLGYYTATYVFSGMACPLRWYLRSQGAGSNTRYQVEGFQSAYLLRRGARPALARRSKRLLSLIMRNCQP